MAELQEATQLLSSPIPSPWRRDQLAFTPHGAQPQQQEPDPIPSPRSPKTPAPWSIPSHLVRLPAIREQVVAAIDSGHLAHTDPSNFETVLQHGLNLQELVSRLPDSPADQLTLLHNACEVYKTANDLQRGRTAVVLFNWAVALSDIARIARSRSADEAAEYLSTAALKYAAAVDIDPQNPQALNNWALTLQELAALAPEEQREALLFPAVARFRAAIRLHPDLNLTSRFCYNLGTVLYSHACHMADKLLGGGDPPSSVAASTSSSTSTSPSSSSSANERKVRQAFAHAASYIVLAYALQPGVRVYEDSIQAVQRLLPLPYLRTGLFFVAAPGTAGTPEESWIPAWFALDAYALQSIRPPPAEAFRFKGAIPNISIEIGDITGTFVCSDPSLPPGWAVWIGLRERSDGLYLIAEEKEDAEGWVDGVRLVGALAGGGGADRLQKALLMRRQKNAGGGGGRRK